jgi:hypothetical protein
MGLHIFMTRATKESLSETGRLVQTVRLDDFGIPNLIKMDIEGAEILALCGSDNILKSGKTTWFIALHGERARLECPDILARSGHSIAWTSPFGPICVPTKGAAAT